VKLKVEIFTLVFARKVRFFISKLKNIELFLMMVDVVTIRLRCVYICRIMHVIFDILTYVFPRYKRNFFLDIIRCLVVTESVFRED